MGINILGIPKYHEKNNRFVYVVNAILILMCVYGSITYMYTALDMKYYGIVMFPIIALAAFISAFMHMRRLCMVGGYLILLSSFMAFTIMFYRYINSGFSHFMNVVYKLIDTKYNLELLREFNEMIENSQLTVTMMGIAIGWVFCILVNILISEYMSAFGVLLVELFFMVIPMYLGREPGIISLLLVLITPLIILIMNNTQKYYYKDKNTSYTARKSIFSKKNSYETKYNSKGYYKCRVMPNAVVKQGISSVILLVPLLILVLLLLPKSITDGRNNNVEDKTKAFVQNVAVYGFEGLFNLGGNTGGLTMDGTIHDGNILGFTDEVVYTAEYVPVNYERVLMPAYIGTVYSGNWNPVFNKDVALYGTSQEKSKLIDDYITIAKGLKDVKGENILTGKMCIKPGSYMKGLPRQLILPYYYSGEEGRLEGGTTGFGILNGEDGVTITYYPYTEGLILSVLDKLESVEIDAEVDRNIYANNNEDISKTVKQFIDKYNLEYVKQDDLLADYEEKMRVVNEISDIFDEDYLYTLRPGKTPGGKNYVKYFLLDNKKGYCAHFATATVLILRELGIPARYVEGYAIDAGGVLLSEDESEGWIWGDNKFGLTRVQRYNVTDRCGHAWAEMYVSGIGWIPVDITPGSEDDSESGGSDFGETLENIANVAGSAAERMSKGLDLIKNNKVTLILVALIAVFTFIIGWVSSILICRKIRKNKFNDKDTEKAIIYIADYAKKVLAFAGYPAKGVYTFKECAVMAMENGKIDLAHAIAIIEPTQKYVYGGYAPAEEERQKALEAVGQICKMIYNDQTWFGKFVFLVVKRFTP